MVGKNKKNEKVSPRSFKAMFSGKSIYSMCVWLISWIIISLLLISPYFSKGIDLSVGQRSNMQVVSPRYFRIQTKSNKAETEKLRKEKQAKVNDVYSINSAISQKSKSELADFFSKVKDVRSNPQNTIDNVVSKSSVNLLISADENIFALLENIIGRIVARLVDQGIKDVNSKQIDAKLTKEINNIRISRKYRSVIKEISKQFIYANLFLDEEKTKQLKKKARMSINTVYTEFKQGQPIIYVGDIVTADHYQILSSLGYIGVHANKLKIFSSSLLVFILLLLIERFLFYFKNDIANNYKLVLLTNLFIIFNLITIKLISIIPKFDLNFWISFNPIPIPEFVTFTALFIMLITILVDIELALIVGFVCSIVASMIFSSLSVMIHSFIISSFSVFFVYKVQERKDITRTGINISIVAEISVLLLFFLFDYGSNVQDVLFTLLWVIVTSLLSAVITIGLLPYFESFFGISTPMLYIELSNPNHPLLKKLTLEAPGTFHHSTVVASLAESAAEAIGADYLLARVGGYFHDIGKIKRPYFFVENQSHSENPHKKLAPQLSATIILSHTKDGVELAKKYKLPKEVLRIIESHHGDTLVYYFYQKYLQKERVEVVAEDQFRYNSPTPVDKETAIILLADSVEAAVRSIDKLSPNKLDGLVKRIIKSKIDDGQLDNSYLSLADIDKIKNSFIKTLAGTYHSRIEYSPEKIAKELDSRKES